MISSILRLNVQVHKLDHEILRSSPIGIIYEDHLIQLSSEKCYSQLSLRPFSNLVLILYKVKPNFTNFYPIWYSLSSWHFALYWLISPPALHSPQELIDSWWLYTQQNTNHVLTYRSISFVLLLRTIWFLMALNSSRLSTKSQIWFVFIFSFIDSSILGLIRAIWALKFCCSAATNADFFPQSQWINERHICISFHQASWDSLHWFHCTCLVCRSQLQFTKLRWWIHLRHYKLNYS